MPHTGRRLGSASGMCVARSAVAVLVAALVTLVLQPTPALAADDANAQSAAGVIAGVPTAVSATAGPGRSYVSFRPADARASSFTVTAWNGTAAAATAT